MCEAQLYISLLPKQSAYLACLFIITQNIPYLSHPPDLCSGVECENVSCVNTHFLMFKHFRWEDSLLGHIKNNTQ